MHKNLVACWPGRSIAIALAMASAVPHSVASEMVYTPTNPSFGGSPLNGSVLLNSALSTNKHTAPASSSSGFKQQTPLQQFNELLERSILNQIASSATSKVSVGGKLVPGTVETANFIIAITDLGGGKLRVTTTDKVTGVSTVFEVSQ